MIKFWIYGVKYVTKVMSFSLYVLKMWLLENSEVCEVLSQHLLVTSSQIRLLMRRSQLSKVFGFFSTTAQWVLLLSQWLSLWPSLGNVFWVLGTEMIDKVHHCNLHHTKSIFQVRERILRFWVLRYGHPWGSLFSLPHYHCAHCTIMKLRYRQVKFPVHGCTTNEC